MPKILKPYTIIPLDLYVQRDADRQVRNIINDMGRPGYVLVSRQMGKTNLLLNAKRNLENELTVFVYVDLSNAYFDARSCFENIVNTAVDSNLVKFEKAAKIIGENRSAYKDLPPHKQYTNELRILLQQLDGGKLVIILDEIDALTKTTYSDQIFSQIRSSYFAERVNYKEFYHLTYLLSGVVEPNEIIKDSKISPFNIGQKIYLNDFSRVEFEKFLQLAHLNLSISCTDRIYFWTNGNPRMTWDLCSEVENQVKLNDLTVEMLDKIAVEMYLTSYDKPPIDNIRELVKNDKDIRSALIQIYEGAGSKISSKIKSKLYLAGITNYTDNDVVIKNEIIRRSLSLDWIKSLEKDEKGLLVQAMDYYEKANYSEALNAFYEYLEHDDFPENSRDLCYYYLAYLEYSESNFKSALKHVETAEFDEEDVPKFYFASLTLRGLIMKGLSNFEECEKDWKYVIDNSRKDENFLRAYTNLANLYMSTLTERVDEAILMYNNLVDNKFELSKRVSEEDRKYYRCISFYQMAVIFKDKEELAKAMECISSSLELATENSKPALLFLMAEIADSDNTKLEILDSILAIIATSGVDNSEPTLDRPMGIDEIQLMDILVEIYRVSKEAFETRVKQFSNKEKDFIALYFEVALHAYNKSDSWQVGIKILNDLNDIINTERYQVDFELHYEVLKSLAYVNNYKESNDISLKYVELFRRSADKIIELRDFSIFADLIHSYTEKQLYEKALGYVEFIKNQRNHVPAEQIGNYLLIEHLELNIYSYTNERQKALYQARHIIDLIDSMEFPHQKSLLGETGLDIIRENAESVIRPRTVVRKPFTKAKVYGRNDRVKVRYQDGSVVEVKFKKVEHDINSGACFILDEL